MRYALLVYGTTPPGPMKDAIAAVLERPSVTGWTRLCPSGSATTLRNHPEDQQRALLIDGPFVDSKEYLAGLIMIEADDLDEALAVAEELQGTRNDGAIEVRPVFDEQLRDA